MQQRLGDPDMWDEEETELVHACMHSGARRSLPTVGNNVARLTAGDTAAAHCTSFCEREAEAELSSGTGTTVTRSRAKGVAALDCSLQSSVAAVL
jgi:hypothetical protein